MKIYNSNLWNKRTNVKNLPNVLAFTFIKSFLTDKQYEDTRREYFINQLSQNQIDESMEAIKWLFRNYKGLDIIQIESADGNISKFVL
ncbi:MAG: hypothetical protein LBN09_08875 [Clostridioides sp.]|jgi:hypothetical protein|nr:hypothetical protein [Clostridioides sp.]